MRISLADREIVVPRNAFQQALLGFDYAPDPERPADIFSRTCVEAYRDRDLSAYGFTFSQVFEPAVLQEAALLEGVDHQAVARLEHRPTEAIEDLAELLGRAAELRVVELVNLACLLITVSRFEAARPVVALAVARASDPRERFEAAWLEFMVSNRCERDRDSPAAFARMRAEIATGAVPVDRVLDTCTQAVVWYTKRKALAEADFTWFVKVGARLAGVASGVASGAASGTASGARAKLAPAAVSAWYRGVAMLPAGQGKAEQTRRYMEAAREAAEEVAVGQPGSYSENFLKTYYESTVKEHMHVTKDYEAAVAAGTALIDLDPLWSASYGELAEAHELFGAPAEAARLYDEAVAVGAPYVGHHLLRAAACYSKLGQHDAALSRCRWLAEFAPGSRRVLELGRKSADHVDEGSQAYFARALESLENR